MSGIVGLMTFDGTPVDPRLVDRMAAAAPHRHPEGIASWAGAGAALQYQRSLVLAGRTDERGLAADGSLVCVADARLDNRAELIVALRGFAHLDDASSEAEILLAAYRRWREQCARRLLGDFAFAVWDSERRALFAARDPMAMRSLAYHIREGRSIAIATEVKQLLALPDVPVRIHEAAVLADMLARFGDPGWSFYAGIDNLSPGHSLVVDESGRRLERFWSPDPEFQLGLSDRRDYADLLRNRFMDAVAARLRTDYPAGILLSGGVDSGSVAAAAGSLIRDGAVPAPTLHAVSWAFDRYPECDERATSRLIADHYKVRQTDVPADGAGPLADYPAHGPDRDDPFLGAFQPLIERSLMAARDEGVRVLLGGDRGDLVIGGTGWSHLWTARARRWGEFVSDLDEHHQVTSDPWNVIAREELFRPALKRLSRRSPMGWVRRLARRASSARHAAQPRWLRTTSPALGAAATSGASMHQDAGFSPQRALRRDTIFTQLHLRGVAWSERTYARHGLAFADPFSDRRIAEFAMAVPQVVINRPAESSKPLMRAAMRGLMPEAARRQMAKTVPTPLFEGALRTDAVAVVRTLLDRPRVADHGWVDADLWRDEYETWRAGGGRLSAEWWWTLGVEIWLRRHW
ncbi:MAG: hypothetical protein H0X68_09420 [Chloroflexi bacterium]|nr:hypothetical protein [Chloroflexota bacterium]